MNDGAQILPSWCPQCRGNNLHGSRSTVAVERDGRFSVRQFRPEFGFQGHLGGTDAAAEARAADNSGGDPVRLRDL